jgi:hypothetical protein
LKILNSIPLLAPSVTALRMTLSVHHHVATDVGVLTLLTACEPIACSTSMNRNQLHLVATMFKAAPWAQNLLCND